MADLDSAKLLWTPANAHETRTTQFMRKVNAKYGLSLSSYDQLWSWSTENIAEFWDLVWEDTNIIGDRGPHVIDRSALPADNPDWFVGSQVNWAENALWCRASDKIAIIEAVEPTPDLASSPLRQITYAELYIQVADIVSALIEYGVKKGDRVASYSSNCIETAVVCLATAAIGALWVSAAADFGPDGVLERFEQVKPKVIFAVNSVSSGTTGKPKPIVHRTGGMLIQSRKELLICADMKPSDVFFYYTTTGWMMYQFLMGGLGVGCTILLYDGSPLRDPSCLWRMTDECKITIFGTSAKYLDQLAVCLKPFPCQPAGFWPLSGYGTDEEVSNAQSRYQDAYFNAFKGIWHHGDYVRITTNGGVVMLGRSDGVLNPGGIRFGSSEIYELWDKLSKGAQTNV
ncbi:acetoacetyl-CoA synthetase [Rhizoctonia solani AG-1 IB]|uniref:Acetoacetyl-CoA synthetase n=1 Tax=Thanatephorus cucumeris (strain AG1-IB / isolate 7/3/14) TaxID=1108050 RepID=M5BHX9_THACB|nr:acetoacetyl-CoA synthetase [Rhizoctonia solani AG-1 IB]